MLELVGNTKIVKAIDSQNKGYKGDPFNLIKLNIFPSLQIPKLQGVKDTYILMACDVQNINAKNPTFHDIRLTIRVLAHQDRLIMKGERDTRIDYIADEIVRMLEESQNYGFGRLKLVQNREMILNESYTFRELFFKTYDVATKLC